MKLFTASESMLSNGDFKYEQKEHIRKSFATMLTVIMKKLQERPPLKSVVVRCSSALPPIEMVRAKDECITKFGVLVNKIFKLNYVPSKEADDSKVQYEEFLGEIVVTNRSDFQGFHYAKQG